MLQVLLFYCQRNPGTEEINVVLLDSPNKIITQFKVFWQSQSFCFCRRLQRHSKLKKQAYSVRSYWAFISNANGSCHSLQVVRVGITFLSCWLTHNSTGDRQSNTFEIKMQPEQKVLMGGTVGRWDLKDETFFISFNPLIEKSTFIYISHNLHGFKKCFINFL